MMLLPVCKFSGLNKNNPLYMLIACVVETLKKDLCLSLIGELIRI